MYTKLISTNGAVSLMRTDQPGLQPFAVILRNGDKVSELLDTFTKREEADEFYSDAQNRIRKGQDWPDPDTQACCEINPKGKLAVASAA